MQKFSLILVTLTFLFACDSGTENTYQLEYSSKAPKTNEHVCIIGVHPLHNPARLHEIFGPIADYLTNNIDGHTFKIEASRNYAAYDKKLYAGSFHFALPNPFQTVNALNHGYSVFGKMADDENFRGIILVRKDSGITEVSDLKGRAVSFPAPTALAATMMPQYYLQSHGLDVMNDIDIRYVGSQESSIMNVMLGDTAAGATWPPPWRALSKERPELAEQLKVIWSTDTLPNNALLYRNDVDMKIVTQVQDLLLNLHKTTKGKVWLKRMELSQFEKADEHTYQPVVDFISLFNTKVRPVK